MADKTYSFQGLSFSDQYCKQKLQDVLLLYTNLIGINVIIIIIINFRNHADGPKGEVSGDELESS